jgi:hypothetical protein
MGIVGTISKGAAVLLLGGTLGYFVGKGTVETTPNKLTMINGKEHIVYFQSPAGAAGGSTVAKNDTIPTDLLYKRNKMVTSFDNYVDQQKKEFSATNGYVWTQ